MGKLYRFKGIHDCTKTAKMYAQMDLRHKHTLDLWLNQYTKRVWVTERDFTEQPDPPKPDAGVIYCGEISRNSIKAGDVELMAIEAVRRRKQPYKYAELHTFLVDPGRRSITEIPRYIPMTDNAAWNPISDQISERVKAYNAATTAIEAFHKKPLKTELMAKVGNLTILVRGHGYYGDI